jgi:hypothetical protein
LRISGSVRCDTQMPSSVKASLLDDGVADALVSGGASMFDISFPSRSRDSARIPSRSSSTRILSTNTFDARRRKTGRETGRHPGTALETISVPPDRHQGMMDVRPCTGANSCDRDCHETTRMDIELRRVIDALPRKVPCLTSQVSGFGLALSPALRYPRCLPA